LLFVVRDGRVTIGVGFIALCSQYDFPAETGRVLERRRAESGRLARIHANRCSNF
jgi:hypothetical protein